MEVFVVVFWIAVILFGVFSANKKKPEAAKKVVEGKKPSELLPMSFEEILAEFQAREQVSQEREKQPYKSQENVQVYTANSESKAIQRKQEKAAKPIKEIKAETKLPSIKATKPPKPQKPSKDQDYEQYAQHAAKENPIKTFIDNPENMRNAFILSEIFKKKF